MATSLGNRLAGLGLLILLLGLGSWGLIQLYQQGESNPQDNPEPGGAGSGSASGPKGADPGGKSGKGEGRFAPIPPDRANRDLDEHFSALAKAGTAEEARDRVI